MIFSHIAIWMTNIVSVSRLIIKFAGEQGSFRCRGEDFVVSAQLHRTTTDLPNMI